LGSADPTGARAIRQADLPAGDRALLEALLWWSVEDDRRATKALRRAGDLPMQRVVEAVDRWVPPDDLTPFATLTALAAHRESAADQRLVDEARARRAAPAQATPAEGADARQGLREALTTARLAVDDPRLWARAAGV